MFDWKPREEEPAVSGDNIVGGLCLVLLVGIAFLTIMGYIDPFWGKL